MLQRSLNYLREPIEPCLFRLQRHDGVTGLRLALAIMVVMTPVTIMAGTPIITPLVTAYTAGIAAYLIDRQEVELEQLAPLIRRPKVVTGIFGFSLREHPRWLLILAWVLGLASMLLVNFSGPQISALRTGVLPDLSGTWGFVAAGIFWVIFFEMLCVFWRNALLFRRLGGEHIRIDLLDQSAVSPFGRIAVRNLLIFVGGLTLAPLQLLFRPDYLPQLLVGNLIVLPCGVALVLLPLWSVHARLVEAKREELDRVQAALRGDRSAMAGSPVADEIERMDAANLLLYREVIANMREWPVDAAAVARFAGYVVIPLLAWVGAALVERWVDFILFPR